MDELLTVTQVAEVLKTNKNLVYNLQKAGLLKGIKLGALKFRARTVEDFLERYDGCDLSDLTRITKMGGTENEKNKVSNIDGLTWRLG